MTIIEQEPKLSLTRSTKHHERCPCNDNTVHSGIFVPMSSSSSSSSSRTETRRRRYHLRRSVMSTFLVVSCVVAFIQCIVLFMPRATALQNNTMFDNSTSATDERNVRPYNNHDHESNLQQSLRGDGGAAAAAAAGTASSNYNNMIDDTYQDIDDVFDQERYILDYDLIEREHHRKLITIFDHNHRIPSTTPQQRQQQSKLIRLSQPQKDITNTSWIVRLESDQAASYISSKIITTKIKKRMTVLLNVLIVQGVTRYTLAWLVQRTDVLLIEENQPVYEVQAPTRPRNTTVNLKDGQPWGIDMVDGNLDRKYTYTYSGQNVSVFIFDSGIMTNHEEFGSGRVTCGYNTILLTEECDDLRGHGTHIAATVGGKTYGLARKVSLINIKVLDKDGNGNVGYILEGLEYVVFRKLLNPATPMIINLSLGSNFSTTFNDAVDRCVDVGVHVVIASGNDELDACTTSPSSAEKGIVAGALDASSVRANWSNYGDCVDIYAPGVTILSANYDARDRKKTTYRSGTSMAAPHVTGVIAMYLEWDPSLTPDAIKEYLLNDSTPDVVKNLRRDGGDDGNNKNNLLINSAKIQTYIPATKAPTLTPTRAPRAPPPTTNCSRIFARCASDSACCTQACLEFEPFGLNIWGQRCFIFG